MSYEAVADMHDSYALQRRLFAAAAQEGKPEPVEAWVGENLWTLAATPGWAAAWESAQAGGNPDPGGDPAVITDGMILGAVQPLT